MFDTLEPLRMFLFHVENQCFFLGLGLSNFIHLYYYICTLCFKTV